jgi:hypothetical protein
MVNMVEKKINLLLSLNHVEIVDSQYTIFMMGKEGIDDESTGYRIDQTAFFMQDLRSAPFGN